MTGTKKKPNTKPGDPGYQTIPSDALGELQLFAHWKAITTSVTFRANYPVEGQGPSSPANKTLDYGAVIDFAPLADTAQYRFVGWNLRSDGSGEWFVNGEAFTRTLRTTVLCDMATNSLDIKKTIYVLFKKEKLFSLFYHYTLTILPTSFFIMLANRVDLNILTSIYLPLVLVILIFVIWYKQRYAYYQMQYEYFRMLNEKQGLIQLNQTIFTNAFVQRFVNDGFKEASTHKDFVLYYQFVKKVKTLANSGQVLVCIVLAKTHDFNFYDQLLDEAIQHLYLNYKDDKKVKKTSCTTV